MARVASAVHVVTTDGTGGCHGITVSALAPVTDAPPTLLICLNRKSRTNAAIKANGVFAVNTLAPDQEAVAAIFAGHADVDMAARFATGDWARLPDGLPVFRHVTAVFGCRLVNTVEAGTHSVFFGEVIHAATFDAAGALVYFNRGYRNLPPGN